MIVARKYFDETEGQCLVKERHGTLKRIPGIQSEGHGLNLDQDMEKKYLALAAAVRLHDPLNRSAAYTSTSNSPKHPAPSAHRFRGMERSKS